MARVGRNGKWFVQCAPWVLAAAAACSSPNRDYTPEHVALVRECGFSAAVSTSWGAASMGSDRFQLPRFSPWDRTRLRFGARMLGKLARTERLAD